MTADGPRLAAVGSNGLMARAKRSLDEWRVIATPVEHNLRGVVWTGERWVLAGDIGTILSGTDGTWTQATGIPNSGLRGIAAQPGLVAASGSNGVVVTSPDGVSWQQAQSGTTEILWGGTTVGQELWLSGGQTTVIRSADGVTWTPVPTFPAPTDSTAAPRPLLWQLASDGDNVVAVGDFGAILEGNAGDGLAAVPSPTDEILRGVATANDRWVAVGSGGKVLFSLEGRNWQLGSAPTTVDLRGVTWTGSRFVAVGDQSTVISSVDGRTWGIEVTAMPCALLGVTHGPRGFVAVGGSGKVMLSPNGRSWTRPDRPTDADLYGVARGPGEFVAVGSGGTVLTSSDGERWSKGRSHTELNLHTVFWTGEEYLAGGDIGRVLSSDDGRDWQQVEFPGFHSVRGFATDGTNLVAAGAGTIARLAPGGEWELEPAGDARFQTSVAYGNGTFVVVGHNGEVQISTDAGQAWTVVPAGVEVNLDAVIWTGSRFLATGEGVAIASADGLTWTPLALGTKRSVRSLVAEGPDVVGVGDGGTRVRLPAG